MCIGLCSAKGMKYPVTTGVVEPVDMAGMSQLKVQLHSMASKNTPHCWSF